MNDIVLTPEVLTAQAFSPFGDVIETYSGDVQKMNEALFHRCDDLAKVDVDTNDGGYVAISIAVSQQSVTMPYRFDVLERHPLGSQAFIPLSAFSFTVVVAPAGDAANVGALRAFTTNGLQGINYHRGTWHMPLIAAYAEQRFLIIDRAPGKDNLQLQTLAESVTLQALSA